MLRRLLALFALLGFTGLAGAGLWYRYFKPEPPPPPPPVEQRYEDIDRQEYEAWMRELGYTE